MIPYIPPSIPLVPFYSQFKDITSLKWQKVGCGVTSLAMVIGYYKPNEVSVNELLRYGIAAGAYDANLGWIHKGLIGVSKKYGFDGASYDLSKLTQEKAFTQFSKSLADGPVLASVHYKFDPKSKIPHLVVIDGIDADSGLVYYNDPAGKEGRQSISKSTFLLAWKKKFIVIRPVLVTQTAKKSVTSKLTS